MAALNIKWESVESISKPVTAVVTGEDAATEESSDKTELKWTDKPIEDGAELARFGVKQPDKYTIDGKQTPTPLDGLGTRPQRIQSAISILSALHDKLQPLTAVMGYFTAPVVLTSVNANSSPTTGELLSISNSVKEIKTVTPTAVTMPKARMKPKVKKKAAKPKKGGAQSGKPTSGAALVRQKTLAKKAFQALF